VTAAMPIITAMPIVTGEATTIITSKTITGIITGTTIIITHIHLHAVLIIAATQVVVVGQE
jgi:hypothetical protein